jgi:hypothetical protein
MLKIRYFRVRLPHTLSAFGELAASAQRKRASSAVTVIRRTSDEVILRYTVVRHITTCQILPDGSELRDTVPTMEQHAIRLFQRNNNTYLSAVDPPRGLKIIGELLEAITENNDYFFEPLELTTSIVDKHIANFDSARLVSAKVRDFQVYEGAIGRLEVTSQAGLQPGIAPFLANKFHRIESLTYEVTRGFVQGLVYYTHNGTVRASGPIVEAVFPSFEASL